MIEVSIIFWLCLSSLALAQLKATGPATWQDTVAGTSHGAFGLGGVPVLCYQTGEDTWDFIKDEWVQVGDAQIWKSVKGNHKVFADSSGKARYQVGNHKLGTNTTHLVKFKIADKSWEVLKTSDPDSVTMSGNKIRFWGIWPGVDKEISNNAKVMERYTETFYFHQEARDSLGDWGPWGGRLVGTATKLNVDSLNLDLSDTAGSFDIDSMGHMVDDWIKFDSSGVKKCYMGTVRLHTVDSLCQNIKIKKWLVKESGTFWLVELFDPIAADQLPEGTLWHNAIIGNNNVTDVAGVSLENTMYGTREEATTTGDLDSITAYVQSSAEFDASMAVYEGSDATSNTLHDTIARTTFNTGGTYAWVSRPVIEGSTITDDSCYIIVSWAENRGGTCYQGQDYDIDYTTDTSATNSDAFNGWDDPNSFTLQFRSRVFIYATYTVAGAPAAGQVIIIGENDEVVDSTGVCAVSGDDCDNLPSAEWIASADSLEVVDCVLIERANSANWAWNDGVLYVKTEIVTDTIYLAENNK
jgi:hypothetical protein